MQLTQCVLQFYLVVQIEVLIGTKNKIRPIFLFFCLKALYLQCNIPMGCYEDILRKAFGLFPSDESRHFI